jgi:HSP90 family molecular chaperone
MMNNFLEKFVLRFVLYTYVFLFSVSIGPEAYMAAGRNFFFVDSYIERIDTPSYGYEITMDVLNKFNSYGNGKAVNFHKKSQTSRAIYITEVQDIPGKESVIGQALPLWDRCDIVIEKGLDQNTYYHVLLHEYLHCMGYMHSQNEQDLMYPSVTYVPESNIMQYAKEVAERNK